MDKPFYVLQQSVPFTILTSTKLGGIAWRCSKSNFTKISPKIWKLGIKLTDVQKEIMTVTEPIFTKLTPVRRRLWRTPKSNSTKIKKNSC